MEQDCFLKITLITISCLLLYSYGAAVAQKQKGHLQRYRILPLSKCTKSVGLNQDISLEYLPGSYTPSMAALILAQLQFPNCPTSFAFSILFCGSILPHSFFFHSPSSAWSTRDHSKQLANAVIIVI